jgi:hypothetical protein
MGRVAAPTEHDLLLALAEATRDGGEDKRAKTVRELVIVTGLSVRRVHAELQRLTALGRVVVHQVRRTAIDGRVQRVAAYTILPKKRR